MNQFKIKRDESGLTQAYVAQYLGLQDKSTVSKWETVEGCFPRTEILPKLAELYNCTIDDLLCKKA